MTEHTLLEGIWQMIRAELGGEEAPELVTKKTQVELAGGTYVVRFDGEVADQGLYQLGENATAPTLLLRGETGLNAGRTIPSIFQLAGDRLRICYGFDGTVPPAFSTTAGDQRYLATYRRRR